MSRTVLAALAFLAACSGEDPSGRNAAEEALDRILADHWDLELQENPVLAVQLGHKEGLGRLPDPSLEAFEEGIEARRGLLERLSAIDPSKLDREDALNRELLMAELEDAVEAGAHDGKFLTITTYDTPHTRLARLADETVLRTDEDVQSYLRRLEGMPAYIDAAIARLRLGIEQGWTQPCEAMAGFERTYETHLVDDVEQSVFLAPFGEESTARDEAARSIEEGVIPAFERFGTFYETEYVPACRDEVGVGSLPGGQEFYAYRTRVFTTTDYTPEEVHEIGLSEVARIRAEMEEAAAQAGFDDLGAFQEHLRTSAVFYPKTAGERIAAASTIAKEMDGKLVELFTVLPRMPYGIRPIPLDVAEGTTTAYYSRPAADGTRAGTYWVNTTKLSTRPLHELEALTLHEAVPGHHLQIALAQELDLPNFRRYGGFTAFTEGWGLYAERLGLEVGFYETPETNFGRLSYEMWRACRLVVDTGMHSKGWTRQEAIDFMLENTGLSRNNIEREVDRYITWPGQALAYKIGELKIRELRARAEETLGEDFDLRRFHDAVLENGALPLSVLEDRIDRWIFEEGTRRRGR